MIITDIRDLTIIGGHGRGGTPETVQEVFLRMGDIVSIVGPTGCGKTTLINDIELFANRDTPSGRKVLFNGATSERETILDPAKNPIALISQHTNFLSDLPVRRFLEVHAQVRRRDDRDDPVEETLSFANKLTGEPIISESAMTELSGGQTRALLIADAVVIGHSPIILLDEIENAGIHRTRALELLRTYEKIFVFVTHDPRIALLSDFRIVMRNGAMQQVISTGPEEQRVADELKKMDDLLLDFRNRLRMGEQLTEQVLKERLADKGYIAG